MSNFKVTVERLTIHEHPNADALELAQVGEYRAVVGKGIYKTGDYAMYIPEQAVLPPELIEELGLTGRLAGPQKDRVKAVRLRGEVSQGIVCRPQVFGPLWDWAPDAIAALSAKQEDCSPVIGVTKWVPPVPVAMAGEVESAPDLIRWIEIDNIKRVPDIFTSGEPVIATEKVHGTCCLLTYDVAEDRTWVTSKGQGGKGLALKETEGNLYWRAVRRYGLAEYAKKLAVRLETSRVALFGEVYGQGVQDLHYGGVAGHDEAIGYALFDVAYLGDFGQPHFLSFSALVRIMLDLDVPPPPMVPVLYDGPYDYEALKDLAEGREEVSGRSLHIREGLVVRTRDHERRSDLYGRAIAKFVSDAYLLRKDGTEYE